MGVYSLNCGLQHILKIVSLDESTRLSTGADDKYWDFFSYEPSVFQNLNEFVKTNTTMDDWLPEFEEPYSSADRVDGIFIEPPSRLVSQLLVVSGKVSHTMAIEESGEDMPDVAKSPVKIFNVGMSKLCQLTSRVLPFHTEKVPDFGSIVWQAAQMVSTTG